MAGALALLTRHPNTETREGRSPLDEGKGVYLVAVLLGLAFALFFQLGVPMRASQGARITGDEPFYLITTESLLSDGNMDLRDEYETQAYRVFFDHPEPLWYQSVPLGDGRLLSPHNAGLSVLVAPAYALGGLDGVKRFLATLGAVTVSFAFLLARRTCGRTWPALGAAILIGLSAPVFVYASQIYPEFPAALLVTAVAWGLLGSRPRWIGAALIAVAIAGLLWLGVKYAPVAAVLGLFALVRLRWPARLVLLGLLAAAGAHYAWFHLATYGGLTPYSVNLIYAGNDTVELVGVHLKLWNRLYRLAGLWIDREFGLLRWVPSLALALPGAVMLIRRPGLARCVIPAVFGVQFLVASFLSITMRGWWFPGRMLIVVLPLLAVCLAGFLAWLRPRAPALLGSGVLGAYSALITLELRGAVLARAVTLAVDPFEMPSRVFQAPARLFPLYTTYTPETWALTAFWLAAACLTAVATVAGLGPALRGVRRRIARMEATQ